MLRARGRKGRRDAALPLDVTQEVVGLADKAEQFFDSLTISGRSKTQKTAAGNPKTVEVNLLSRRLHIADDLARDADNRSAVAASAARSAMLKARRAFDADGRLADAVEARLLYDKQQ